MLHELIHLYDLRVKKLDFSNCRQLGYSEVRAAREAECQQGNYGGVFKRWCKDKKREEEEGSVNFGTGGFLSSITTRITSPLTSTSTNLCEMWRRSCVIERATSATSTMYPSHAATSDRNDGTKCVMEAFEEAFGDLEPWSKPKNTTTTPVPITPTKMAAASATRLRKVPPFL